jgi:DNA sulfur modification protein DndC
MHNVAMQFLAHILELSHSGVPVAAHMVHPDWAQTFWVLLLGKGYPVPHRRFWWCTERLKINPVKKVLKELGRGDDVAILTGVRFGESSRRDGKMKRAAPYCVGQGECGQSLEYHGALAPIAHWKTCHIGISLRSMRRLGDGLRWMWSGCTAMHRFVLGAVEKDRALEAVMAKDDAGYLQELARFRKRLMDISNDPSMRVQRPDGKPGKLKAEVRRVLLDELLQLQTKAGIQLICPEEIRIIQELWGDTDGYKNS